MISSTSSSRESSYRKRRRRLIANLLMRTLIFIPLVIPLALVNYAVDPGSIFRSDDSMKGIASLLLQHKNVAILWDYDSRLLQKFYMEKLTKKNDVIIFGSSRSLQINSQLFPGKTFFNNAVSASVLKDYIGIFELYREKDLLPDAIVLGVDPWIFNKNNHVQTWKTLDVYALKFFSVAGLYTERPYLSVMNNISISLFQLYKYMQLFSLSYFQASVHRLRSLLRENPANALFQKRYYPTDKTESDVAIKLSDGSMVYQESERVKRSEAVLQDIKAAFILDHFSRQAFTAIDPELANEFEVFVAYLQQKKIKVIFWLAPYHPYAYNYLVTHEKYAVMKEVESYVKKFALKNDIPLIGSYDPAACDLRENDFYDAIHPKRKSVVALFEQYLKHPCGDGDSP